MGDDNPLARASFDMLADEGSIRVREVQAVFGEDGFNYKIESGVAALEHVGHLRRTNLVLAGRVKIDFVNRSASGEEMDVHGPKVWRQDRRRK